MSLELDTIERKKIEKLRRAERDMRIWRRLSALLWSDDGETAEEVARRLGVTARQIRKWLETYRTQGLAGLCELHYRGRVKARRRPGRGTQGGNRQGPVPHG